MEIITSLQNSRIKNVIKLTEKPSERRAQRLIVIEGLREMTLAARAGFRIDSLFVCPDKVRDRGGVEALTEAAGAAFEVTSPVFEKMAYRENVDGVIALAVPRQLSLAGLKLPAAPLVVVLEAVEKPGNLGAILRTADAARVDAVIVCDPQTDLFNPNTIRSSLGCLFTNQVVAAPSEEVLRWLKTNKITSYAAALTGKEYYHHQDFTRPTALVMGTEATGLTSVWLYGAGKQIKVPMRGEVDSLNVSATTAILIFEACRQRNFGIA